MYVLILGILTVLALGGLSLLSHYLIGFEVDEDKGDIVPAVIVSTTVISYPPGSFLETNSLQATIMDLFSKLVLCVYEHKTIRAKYE